ncbi:FAD-dependent oxidoreductase [Ktedonosporobacter rubrisoli]|uniref:FAD-dependent oxidoreductase n=1 Tax=Ktedonosporobacter rubrisoli TaxID=2509675 RepID=A0A4P6K0Z6_KTERU|nr:FAD-dependent oxidoreductase [Ktedonosporobacter rubrisoli]QBD81739.1 FAD-dependent oxidoreductase [Ktedonosporobacter rubrisoli]
MRLRHVPVLIVGGGPAGLSCALFLAQHQIPYLLVERHSGPTIHARPIGLSPRTMELLRQLELEEAVHAAAAPLAQARGEISLGMLTRTNLERAQRTTPDGDELEFEEQMKTLISMHSPSTVCPCNLADLERILTAAALKHGGDLRFHTELISFKQDSTGITAVLLEHKGSELKESVHADYLIAADGAHSLVLRCLELATTGRGELGMHFLHISFQADLSEIVHGHEFLLCTIEHSEVSGLLMTINNTDRWLFHIPYHPEVGETPEQFTPDFCRDLLRKITDQPDLSVEILSILPWTPMERIAECFNKDRVFLVGDAAHVMYPTGGAGANTGIQDAHNLAWKLATVLRGLARPPLLETYDTERRPVACLTAAQEVPTAEKQETAPAHPLYIALGYYYASEAIITQEGYTPQLHALDLDGHPGTRAPHLWVEYQGKRISLLDLFGKSFILLTGEEGTGWHEAYSSVASGLSLDVAMYRIAPDGDVVELEQAWCIAYGVSASGAAIIRPDGFVAWRAKTSIPNPAAELEVVLMRLLCRNS